MNTKPIIYQVLPRLFTNYNADLTPGGTLEQNGSGKLNQITARVLDGIKELGVTHVWYTGIIEHATATDFSAAGIAPDNPKVVKGVAGSPYAIKDYYDVNPFLAEEVDNRMAEFEALVERTHKAGMKVLIDFVPNHTARQYHSDSAPAGIEDFGARDNSAAEFLPSNNYYYISRQQFVPSIDLGEGDEAYIEFPAKATGNDCFTAFPGRDDWYETVKLNYGQNYADGSKHFQPIPDTWFKMLHILRFWCGKGVDGFRCDMAFMVPTEFWQWAIPNVKEHYPDVIFIAEIYDTGLYREFIDVAGFDYLYDKVNLYDTLRGIECNHISAAQLTRCWQTVNGLEPHLLNFLENHDEQRFASRFYAGDAARVLPSLAVSAFIGTGAMMIYAGQELGEKGEDAEGFSGFDGRTTIFDYWSVDTTRRWLDDGNVTDRLLTDDERRLRRLYARVLNICNTERAIRAGRFFDLMYVNYDNPDVDPHRQYVFLRCYAGETILVAVNFADHPVDMKINIPGHAFEVLDLVEQSLLATELISGETAVKHFTRERPFETRVDAAGAVVWRMRAATR
ncbi:MAG: alpha-amylase [Muribaculaceae bacterium]|nr:alpha-amylase [Muribaculaceae bacterium]